MWRCGRRVSPRDRLQAAPDDSWVYVLVLLEFQSGVDRRMALRVLTYTGLAWEGLLRRGEGSGDDTRSVTPLAILHRLGAVLAGPEHAELRTAFAQWLRWSWDKNYDSEAGANDEVSGELDRLMAAGEIEAMGSLAAQRWKERQRQKEAQILARGRTEGLTEGLENERRLLGSLAARRFGADTGKRLSVLLAGLSDPERLAAVGNAIIDSNTGAELLAAARRIVGAVN